MQGAEGCEGGCGGYPNVLRLRGPRVGSCNVAICKECLMVGRGRVEALVQGLPGTNWRYQTGMLLQHDVINRPGFVLQTPPSLIHSLILFLQIFTTPNNMFTACHKSGVTCHVSCVTCKIFFYFLFFYKTVKLVRGGSVINGATPSSFEIDRFDFYHL